MKTITIKQPWAGLLVLGIKKNETRSWNTKHRGLLAIHSSAKMPPEGEELLKGLMDSDPTRFFEGSEAYKTCTELGCILGTVEVVETFSTNNVTPPQSLERMLGNYERNRYFWQCANPVLFPTPILAIGKLSIWNYKPLSESDSQTAEDIYIYNQILDSNGLSLAGPEVKSRKEIEDKIKLNEDLIRKLEIETVDLEREAMLLCDSEQWYTERVEIRVINRVNTEFHVGRINWQDKFLDEYTSEEVIIDRSKVVRVNGR